MLNRYQTISLSPHYWGASVEDPYTLGKRFGQHMLCGSYYGNSECFPLDHKICMIVLNIESKFASSAPFILSVWPIWRWVARYLQIFFSDIVYLDLCHGARYYICSSQPTGTVFDTFFRFVFSAVFTLGVLENIIQYRHCDIAKVRSLVIARLCYLLNTLKAEINRHTLSVMILELSYRNFSVIAIIQTILDYKWTKCCLCTYWIKVNVLKL